MNPLFLTFLARPKFCTLEMHASFSHLSSKIFPDDLKSCFFQHLCGFSMGIIHVIHILIHIFHIFV